MNMKEAEDAIIARLKAATAFNAASKWKVEAFPNLPDKFTFTTEKTLLVTYERSTYAEPRSMQPMHQMRDAEFSVTMLVRGMRGPGGVLETLENIRHELQGWRPTKLVDVEGTPTPTPIGLMPMVPRKDEFVSEDNGIWRWVFNFTATTVAVQRDE